MADTGTLLWHDITMDRTFYYNDLIITRNTVMSNAEYVSKGYNSTMVLEGANFILTTND